MLRGCLDHMLGLGKREGHRLLDDDVLAMLSGEKGMGAMEPVRRGDPDRFDPWVSAELLDAVIDADTVMGLESRTDTGVGIRAGDESHLGHRGHRRQDAGCAYTNAGDAHFEYSLGGHEVSAALVGIPLQYCDHLQLQNGCAGKIGLDGMAGRTVVLIWKHLQPFLVDQFPVLQVF